MTELTLDDLKRGSKRTLAQALADIEAYPSDPTVAALLDEALAEPNGFCLGMTGPPGVGKSTLIDALIRSFRGHERSVGVIAVDPSSRISGGALLGDRTRLSTDPDDQGVFVRSMAARDRFGGVAEITFPSMILMRAIYDLVIIETVGVGQSETNVAEIADLTAFCAQPGSGDTLQYMKAGVMEVPDLVIVTKADLGKIARRTVSDLKSALSLTATGDTPKKIVSCSTLSGEGIEDLANWIINHAAQFQPLSAERRLQQANRWADLNILSRFGSEGLNLVHGQAVDNFSKTPFCHNLRQASRISAALSEAF